MATDIQQQIEERLKAQQEGKEYKDIGRVANTKKERAAFKLISSKMLSDLEEDEVMAYNMVTKENVWPAYNVQELKDKGNSSGCAFMKVKIRASVPKRPANTASKRSSYVHFLELMISDLDKCYTYESVYDLMQSYRKMPVEKIIEYFIDPSILPLSQEKKNEIVEKVKASPILYRLQREGASINLIQEVFSKEMSNLMFNRLSDAASMTWRMGREFDPITQESAEKNILGLKERSTKSIQEETDKIEKYKIWTSILLQLDLKESYLSTATKKIFIENLEKYREYLIEQSRYKIENIKKNQESLILKYSARPNDWSWFEEKKSPAQKSEKPKQKQINTKEPLSYIKRTGGLKIPSIKVQDIIDMFGFSAVNYGKYVDDTWSKNHTKHFLGAISDLAEILNFDIKQVNQLGQLSIAFGAKGHPGHMATYFPQTKDINLTRGNGDGSLAHEWGHYLDNVLSDLDVKKGTPKYGTEGGAVNPVIADIFKKIMQFIFKGNPEYTPRIPMLFYAKKQEEAPTFYKTSIGKVTVQILDDIESTINQYLDIAIVDPNYHSTQLRVFGYIIDKFGLETYEVPMKLKTSYQWHKSRYRSFIYCGKDEKGRPAIVTEARSKYWTENVELFARAFETIVLKKLLDKNRVSNYLVADINMEDIIAETWFEPYPQGKELEYLETLIDELFVAMKTIYSIGDYVPVSNIREDEYLDITVKSDEGKTETGMVVDKSSSEKTTTFIEENQVVETIKKPRTRKPKVVSEPISEESMTISTPPEQISAPVQEISAPPQDEPEITTKETEEMTPVKVDTNVTPKAMTWDQVPVRWKNVKAVRPTIVSVNPYDKNLLTIAKIIVKDYSSNVNPSPLYTALHFDETGVTITDARKLLHIHSANSDFSGNYPSALTSKLVDVKDKKQLDYFKEMKYPNWRGAIPEISDRPYKIEISKLYQYASVASNYANSSTHSIVLRYGNSDVIGFNSEYLLDILETLMKLQSEKYIYVHISSPSRGAMFSFEEKIDKEKSTYALLMPQYDRDNILGAHDIDKGKSLDCYFDFATGEIHNADGSIAEYQENYGDAPGLPASYIEMFNSFLKSSKVANKKYIFSYVRISSDGIMVSDEKSRIEIPNDYDLEPGLYNIENNVLIKDFSIGIEEYEVEKRVSTKDPLFVAKTEPFLFYLNKSINHLSNDDFRPVFQGVIYQKTDDRVNSISTDAHTLLKLDISNAIISSQENFSFVLSSINQLMNVFKSIESDEISVYVDKNLNKYRLVANRLHFEGELLYNGIPNWKPLIPNIFKHKLEFNIKNLFECLSNPELKKYADEYGVKVNQLTVFNDFDKLYAIADPARNPNSVKICDLPIKHMDINEIFDIKQNFVGIMPVKDANGNYLNLNVAKLKDVIASIGKEKCQVYYNDLLGIYVFTSENLNYKTSDVYKPEKPKKATPKAVQQPKKSDEKQEIQDALTGAKTLLKYVKGQEKSNLQAYIKGLEILLK